MNERKQDKKIMITGFTPFGGEKINPAFEAIKLIGEDMKGIDIVKVEIPTVFYESIKVLEKNIELHNPDIIICVGQAGGRTNITIERIGINLDDAAIPDNDKQQPIDKKIFEDGDNAYFSNLPIKFMVQEIRRQGIPASISNTAGTYVCNHLLYGLMYLIHNKYKEKKGGFIHVPYMTAQVVDKRSTPAMSLEEISKGLEYAIKASIRDEEDIKNAEGQIC